MRLPDQFMLDVNSGIAELALPILILIGAVTVMGILVMLPFVGRKSPKFAPFLMAFSFLGAVSGVIAGASQEPIIGAMLTGLLGIVSALLAYLFAKDAAKEFHPVIPFAIIFMVTCALGGLTIGGIRKAKFDNFDREFAIYKSQLENLYYPVEREHRLMRLRRLYRESEPQEGAPTVSGTVSAHRPARHGN